MPPRFFARQALWRAWLAKHHDNTGECLVGFWKKATGKPSIDWEQSVDEALCFGWIDGVRKSLGEESFAIRFTPRRAGSIWSARNLERVKELEAAGLMHAAGLAAFTGRDPKQANAYPNQQRKRPELGKDLERMFRKEAAAWKAWQGMAPYYRKTASWWVISAKQEATRLRRLGILMEYSAKGEKVPPLRPPAPEPGRASA